MIPWLPLLFERMSRNFLMCSAVSISSAIRSASALFRFKVMIKAEHAGDTCSAFSDVVNFVVGRTQDFAGSAVVVDVPGVRVNHSEHS